MINVGIIGATGYGGGELVRILSAHPMVKIKHITSQSYINKPFYETFGNFLNVNDIVCEEENLEKMAEDCDCIFIALPHGVASRKVNAEILNKVKIIDFGADFRLKDVDIYEKWYGVEHGAKELLVEAVYGLSELNRDNIKNARLIANPGCYTTCSILCLHPLLAEGLIEKDGIIIDAKSGVSGAGRGLDLGVHFNEVNESIKPYKVAGHRHTPEIEEQLSYALNDGNSITLSFTPHLIPMNRGVMTTCYARPKKGVNYAQIKQAFENFYKDELFIRMTRQGTFPETKWVKASNFCDIGFTLDERTNNLVIVGALDNLVKGAAGQAVQNMNITFCLNEKTGLNYVPIFPC